MADKVKPGQKQQYFWTKYLDKRAAAKANRRESSIPKAPTSAADKRNLILCVIIVIAVPIVFEVLTAISNKPAPRAPGSPPPVDLSK